MPDAPITTLQVVQRGVEVTPGTLVAATKRVNIVPGSVDLDIEYGVIRRRYAGSFATSHGSSPGLESAGLSYQERGTYDELALDLTAFLGPAVITGASADKTWTFTPSDIADVLKRWSYQVGGVDTWPEEEKLSGCVGSELTITWNKNDDWMLSVGLVAVRNTQGAKTGSLTMPATLVPILGRLTRVYIDPTTFGSTTYGRAISGEIRIETGVSRRYGSDGNAYPNRIALIGPRVVAASLIVEYDSTVLRTALRAATVQKVRVEAPGAALGGSTYNARFDIPGTWEAATIGEDDGVTTLALDLTAQYDSGLAADLSAVVVCSLTALP